MGFSPTRGDNESTIPFSNIHTTKTICVLYRRLSISKHLCMAYKWQTILILPYSCGIWRSICDIDGIVFSGIYGVDQDL